MAEQSKKTTTPTPKAKHPGGRPTKLTRELVDRAAEYVQAQDSLITGSTIATVERLAIILDVSKETLYDWAEKRKTPLQVQFSDVFTRLKEVQADKLLQWGLVGKYNPVIAKLMLTKHDFSDKTQTDVTTNGKDIQLPTPILGGASQEKSE